MRLDAHLRSLRRVGMALTAAGLTAILLSACGGGAGTATPSPMQVVQANLPADFRIEVYQGENALGGSSVQFSEVVAQGRPVVLVMLAGRCGYCRRQLPMIQELHAQYGDQVLFLGVDVGEFMGLGSRDDVLELIVQQHLTFPIGTVRSIQAIGAYRVSGTPTLFFITPQGRVLRQQVGLMPAEALAQAVQELLRASH
ncbi:MAG: TlpA family protein disulfide reductase [Anaerolineae bacterium]